MSSEEEAIHHEEETEESEEDEKVCAYHDIITERNYAEYFDAARRFVAARDYDEACLLLRALILKGTEIFGSAAHIRLAAAYFEMGHALLESLEQTPQAFARPVEGEESVASAQEVESAWENLEVARTIAERYLRDQPNLDDRERRGYQSLLANTYLRLGDLQNWKEDFPAALAEYQSSLGFLRQIEDAASSRRVAELHFLMGNTHVYNFGADAQALEAALECYREGRKVLICLQERGESGSGELADLIVSFDLKIEEVGEELANKQQIIEELGKIRDIGEQKEEFAKTAFAEEPRQIGKFGGGKRLPDQPIVDEKPRKQTLPDDPEAGNPPTKE